MRGNTPFWKNFGIGERGSGIGDWGKGNRMIRQGRQGREEKEKFVFLSLPSPQSLIPFPRSPIPDPLSPFA
ncbi:hypothetical protein B4U84_02625 [Westiellopsis prolifica IICB1]|nr:hypothetical protein B4U84_02625 [Westiellopsis prolifica IICB1]